MTTISNVRAKPAKRYSGLSRGARIVRSLTFIIPMAIMLLLVFISIFAPLIAPYNPTEQHMLERRLPPAFMEGGTTKYFFGTDHMGRDILSRMIYGGRVSLSVSLLAIMITAGIGTVMGIASGFIGGGPRRVFPRVKDLGRVFH